MTETQQDWAAQVERDMRMAHLISRAEHEALMAAAVAAALREAADACDKWADGSENWEGGEAWAFGEAGTRILSLIPDAGAALDRALREERGKIRAAVVRLSASGKISSEATEHFLAAIRAQEGE